MSALADPQVLGSRGARGDVGAAACGDRTVHELRPEFGRILYSSAEKQVMKTVYIVAIIAAAVVLGAAMVRGSNELPANPTLSLAAPPAAPAAPVPPATGPIPSQVAASVPMQTIPAPTKAAQIRALLARGTPKDSYQAFLLVEACRFARQREVQFKQDPKAYTGTPPDPFVVCGDIDPGQMSSGFLYLRAAAMAGVHGAAASFLHFGPDGNGEPAATDPTYAAWQAEAKQVIQAGEAKGDPYTLVSIASRLDASRDQADKAKAWAYWVAANQMTIEGEGKPMRTFPSLEKNALKILSPEELRTSQQIASSLIQSFHRESK